MVRRATAAWWPGGQRVRMDWRWESESNCLDGGGEGIGRLKRALWVVVEMDLSLGDGSGWVLKRVGSLATFRSHALWYGVKTLMGVPAPPVSLVGSMTVWSWKSWNLTSWSDSLLYKSISRRSSSTSYSKLANTWLMLCCLMNSMILAPFSPLASVIRGTIGMCSFSSSLCMIFNPSSMKSVRAGLVPCHSRSLGENRNAVNNGTEAFFAAAEAADKATLS